MERSDIVERRDVLVKHEKDCHKMIAIDLGASAIAGYVFYRTGIYMVAGASLIFAVEGGVNILISQTNSRRAAAIEGALAEHDLNLVAQQHLEIE